MKSGIFILILAITFSISANAAFRCEAIFSDVANTRQQAKAWEPSEKLSKYEGQLNKEALQKAGFRVDSQGRLRDVTKKDAIVGKVLVSKSEYLFEWADLDVHQDIVNGNGISKAWMKDILEAGSQAAGRGFYVSLDPVNSAGFGSHLSVFKTNKKIMILEFPHYTDAQVADSKYLQRLESAGFDALRYNGYQPTWLSVISTRQLRFNGQIPEQVVEYIYKIAVYDTILKPQVLEYLRKKTGSKKLFKTLESTSKLTAREVLQAASLLGEANLSRLLKSAFRETNNQDFFSADLVKLMAHPEQSYLRDALGEQFVSRLMSRSNEPISLDEMTVLQNICSSDAFTNRSLTLLKHSWSKIDPKTWEQIPSNEFSRLALGRASAADLKIILEKFAISSVWATGSIKTLWFERLEELTLNAQKPEDLMATLAIFKNISGYEMTNFYELVSAKMDLFENPPQSKTELEYGRVLELYDMSTVVHSADKKISEPITLAKMKKGANEAFDKLQQLNSRKSDWTWKDLEKFAGDMYGIKYKVRNYDVVMAEDGVKGSESIPLHPSVYNILKTNSILKLSPAIKEGKHLRVQVEYGDLQSPSAQTTLNDIIYKINSRNFLRRDDAYRIFISLHPYGDGNGRMSRLIYYLMKDSRAIETNKSLGLPIYDWDLFLSPQEFKEQQAMGALLKKWIRSAKDDQEFVLRSRWGVHLLEQMYPDLKAN